MVVESVSAVASTLNTGTVTLVKPAGLTAGELLIATLSSFSGDGSNDASTIETRSGWTVVQSTKHASGIINNIQYKVADSGDVAASDFVFTSNIAGGSGNTLVGQIIRASGQNTSTFLGASGVYTNTSANSASFVGTLTSYATPADGALVVAQISTEWSSGGTQRSFTSQAVSGASLTEGYDLSSNDGSGGIAASSAYGIQATAAAISEWTATINVSSNEHFGQIAIFLPPVNASATNTLVETDTTTFTQAGTNDGIIGNVLTETDAFGFTQTGRGLSPQPWVDQTKTSGTWTDQTK